MAVKTAQEILSALNALIGDNDSTEYVTLLEDITDSMVPQDSSDAEHWKNEYTTLQAKYKERFFSGSEQKPNDTLPPIEEPIEEETPTEYDDLFVEKEN